MLLSFSEVEDIKNNQFTYIKHLPSVVSTQYQGITPMLRGFFTICDELSRNSFYLFPAEKAVSSIVIDKYELVFSCEKYLITKDKYPYNVDEVLNQYKKYFSYLERKANGRVIIFNICVPFVFESENIYLYGYYMFLDEISPSGIVHNVHKPGSDLDDWY